MRKIIAFFFIFFLLLLGSPLTAQQAQTVTANFNNGVLGEQGQNTQSLNNPIHFTSANISSIAFSQETTDPDGLFQVQGNDIPGTVTVYFADGSTSTYLSSSVVWVKNNNPTDLIGMILNGAGVAPGTVEDTFSINSSYYPNLGDPDAYQDVNSDGNLDFLVRRGSFGTQRCDDPVGEACATNIAVGAATFIYSDFPEGVDFGGSANTGAALDALNRHSPSSVAADVNVP